MGERLGFVGLAGGAGSARTPVGVRNGKRRARTTVVSAKSGSRKGRNCLTDGVNEQEPQPVLRDLDVVLCHMQADYDTLAAAVGLAKLWGPAAVVVLSGGANPAVDRFLSLFRPMFPIRSPKSVDARRIRNVGVVDTASRDRLGPCAEWTAVAQGVRVIDHHMAGPKKGNEGAEKEEVCDITNDNGNVTLIREPVGAATTIIVEWLLESERRLTPGEATLMALGIHTDTGSLTFDNTTPRDAKALAWLLEQGANQTSIAEFKTQQLNDAQMKVLNMGLRNIDKVPVNGLMLGHCLIETEDFVKGLSIVAQDVMQLSNVDVLLFCVVNNVKHRNGKVREEDGRIRRQISLIGRVRPRVDERVNLNEVFKPLGGGGHPKAAAVTIRTERDPEEVLDDAVAAVTAQVPELQVARDFMSKQFVVCRPQDSMLLAKELMNRHCLSGVPVVGEDDVTLKGTVLQADVWTAEKQDRLDDPISRFMRRGSHVVTIGPYTSLPEVESILALGKSGPLPVVEGQRVVGLVTRIDVLRARHLWGSGDVDEASELDGESDLPFPTADSEGVNLGSSNSSFDVGAA